MIIELFFMDGYGIYVWSAFAFTLLSFFSLFYLVNAQFLKEHQKFISKFGTLSSEKANLAKSQIINRKILSINSTI
tara:strand:+ start:310 stop:537 length:228 start_codon:yes stop_codon:yes gene_type:complete